LGRGIKKSCDYCLGKGYVSAGTWSVLTKGKVFLKIKNELF